MHIVRDLTSRPDGLTSTALTIGAYDGVHLGHRTILAAVRDRAAELGSSSAVVTFDRHPAEIRCW